MPEESKAPVFDDFADASLKKTLAYIFIPLWLVMGAWLYCVLQEPNCQDRQKAAESAKPKANYSEYLDTVYRINTQKPEQQSVESETRGRCSIPCNLINKALEDPIALFNGLLAYAVLLQLLMMNRQETWMRRSYKAAAKSAWAATNSFVTVQDTAKRQLRAYVALETIEHDIVDNGRGQSIAGDHVKIRIKNYGQTPAHHVAIVQTCFEVEQPDGYKHPPTTDSDEFGNQMLHPEQSFNQLVFRSKGDQCVDRVIDVGLHQESVFYVYGRIDYMDIYKRYWITYFCQRYDPRMQEGKRCTPHRYHNYEFPIA